MAASPSAASTHHSIIPHIHLLCMQPSAASAFRTAVQSHDPDLSSASVLSYTIHEGSLSQLDPSLRFDLVVSPANSFGLLDGGFDDAISRAWSPRTDYGALMRALQADLYAKYRGFQPPGTCHLFRMPGEFRGKLRYGDGNGWGCRYLAHCPTMRVPSSCVWDKEVVYECVWSLLCAVDGHNRAVKATGKQGEGGAGATDMIRSVLMTPLGTGAGEVSNERWAAQAVLAIKHFIEAVNTPEKWSCLNWNDALEISSEVAEFHRQ